MCGFNVLFVYVLLGILILSMFMKCNVFLGDGMLFFLDEIFRKKDKFFLLLWNNV